MNREASAPLVLVTLALFMAALIHLMVVMS